MALTSELFSAILAMDAYNRGYNSGINGLGGPGSQLGNATIASQSDTGANSDEVAASFYALAYDVST